LVGSKADLEVEGAYLGPAEGQGACLEDLVEEEGPFQEVEVVGPCLVEEPTPSQEEEGVEEADLILRCLHLVGEAEGPSQGAVEEEA
jgi:hypothetical protein